MKIQPLTNPQLLSRPSSGRSTVTSTTVSKPLFTDRFSLTMKDPRTLVTGQLNQSIMQPAPYGKVTTLPEGSKLLIPQPPEELQATKLRPMPPAEGGKLLIPQPPEELQTAKLRPLPPDEGGNLLIPQPPAEEKESQIEGTVQPAEVGSLLTLT